MTADDESHGAAVIDIIEKRMQENAALRAENQRLREALQMFVEAEDDWNKRDGTFDDPLTDAYHAARRALESDNAQS